MECLSGSSQACGRPYTTREPPLHRGPGCAHPTAGRLSHAEFAGVPGVGKTQLGMQLAVNVHTPEAFGGLGGEAVYIDTEGSFLAERVADMAKGLLAHLDMIAHRERQPQQLAALASLDINRLLAGIHCFRATPPVLGRRPRSGRSCLSPGRLVRGVAPPTTHPQPRAASVLPRHPSHEPKSPANLSQLCRAHSPAGRTALQAAQDAAPGARCDERRA